jgi:ADP-ribose pyrophosphatase YjhB (NUDIX family)
METPRKLEVTVRALIVDQSKLLMVKHKPTHNYYALPGGRLEIGETLSTGLARELLEETAVSADIGPLLFINQFINPHHHRVEFFFWVNNPTSFRQANPAAATHGFEISDIRFDDPTDPQLNLLPAFLRDRFPRLLALEAGYPTELVQS